MIFGIGLDVLEIERLKKLLAFPKSRLKETAFTGYELEYAREKGIEHLATTFAAKEAVFKCLNLPAEKVCLQEIEIRRAVSGRPEIRLFGRLARRFPRKRFRFSISLTYSRELALASVILERV
jgi:holo-[acyl-carrier protein] synthase